jgi:4'-phosphopantetheinyl transferase
MCAVAAPDVQLGCDLEVVEPHSQAFVRDYFTAEERSLIAAHPETIEGLVSLIWSAKESALKVLRTGLRDDTRSVSVCALDPLSVEGSWVQLSVRIRGDRILRGWWQSADKLLRTLIAAPAARVPVALS